MCRNRQCVPLQITPCPSANSLPCSGNGVRRIVPTSSTHRPIQHIATTSGLCFVLMQQCNDLNQCSCNEGFTGANCNTDTGGTTNGGCGRILLIMTWSSHAVNGGWSQWTSWSSCSLTCGGGTRTRTRTCTNPTPQGSGADCVGSSLGSEGCNMVECPGKCVYV